MKYRNRATEVPVTILSGRLLDQAGLLGVLNTLYDLRLPLLSVECEDCDGEPFYEGGND